MQKTVHLAICLLPVLLIAACASTLSIDPEGMTLCSNPRPQGCIMEYSPVCGYSENGNSRSYASACTACGDSNIIGYNPGDC